MKIIGFWHVALVGCAERIFPQQWLKLKESGLYDASDKIYVHVVGTEDPDRAPSPEPNKIGFPADVMNDPKVVFSTTGTRYVFEYPTLNMVHEAAMNSAEPFYAYYIHTKGATTANHFIPNAAYWWGQYIEHYAITKWKANVAKLDEGYDISGVEWRDGPSPHFSGNFWWARSEYLAKLPHAQEYWHKWKHDRIMAEMYIGLAAPKYHCFMNTGQNLYLYSCTKDMWS